MDQVVVHVAALEAAEPRISMYWRKNVPEAWTEVGTFQEEYQWEDDPVAKLGKVLHLLSDVVLVLEEGV